MRCAFVFPGQGSQVVGMGADIAAAYPAARAMFERADELLGFSLSDLIFTGEQAQLDQTLNTQPALYVVEIAILRALEAASVPQPLCVAGHSVGEFVALTAAGALDFDDGLRLVRERGRLMTEAGEQQPGAMAALLGLNADAVWAVCAQASTETGGVLVVANDNCPGQVVISGDTETLSRGLELAKTAGARRAVRLAVSIAAHSPLMRQAAEQFQQVLAETAFHYPRIPIYGNGSAAPLESAAAIRTELERHLTQPVRWTESVREIITTEVDYFVEIGPKEVLTGLLRRIDAAANGSSIQSLENLNAFVQNTLS